MTTDVTDRDTKSTEEHDVQRKIRQGAVFVVVGRIGGVALIFLVNAILARALPPNDYATYLLLMSWIVCGGILGRMGMDRVMIRYISESMATNDADRLRSSLRQSLYIVAIASSLLAMISFAILPYFSSTVFGLTLDPGTLAIVVILFLIATALQLCTEYLRGFDEIQLSALFDAKVSGPLVNFVNVVALLCLLNTGRLTLQVALSAYLFSMIVTLVGAAIALYNRSKTLLQSTSDTQALTESIPVTKLNLAIVAWPILLTQVIEFLTTNGDLWIVVSRCESVEAAAYGAARRLALLFALPIYMVNNTIMGSIPRLNALQKRDELQSMLQGSAFLATMASFAMMLPVLSMPQLTLQLVYGSQYAPYGMTLICLALGYGIFCATGSAAFALLLTGHERFVLISTFATGLLLLYGGPFVAETYGINGVAIFSTVLLFVKQISLCVAARKYVGVWSYANPSSFRWLTQNRSRTKAEC